MPVSSASEVIEIVDSSEVTSSVDVCGTLLVASSVSTSEVEELDSPRPRPEASKALELVVTVLLVGLLVVEVVLLDKAAPLPGAKVGDVFEVVEIFEVVLAFEVVVEVFLVVGEVFLVVVEVFLVVVEVFLVVVEVFFVVVVVGFLVLVVDGFSVVLVDGFFVVVDVTFVVVVAPAVVGGLTVVAEDPLVEGDPREVEEPFVPDEASVEVVDPGEETAVEDRELPLPS